MTQIMFLARSITWGMQRKPSQWFLKKDSSLVVIYVCRSRQIDTARSEITHTWHGWASAREVIGGRKSFERAVEVKICNIKFFRGLPSTYQSSVAPTYTHNTEHLYLFCCVAASQPKSRDVAQQLKCLSSCEKKSSHSCPEGIDVLSIVSFQTLSNGFGADIKILCVYL